MATIYQALVTSVLLLWGYVVVTGLSAGAGEEALAWHLRVGLVGAIAGGVVQSLPFAYFLGTHFWVKAFARASGAGEAWEERHRQWMKGRAYPALYLAPLLTMAAAIAGGMAETGRVPALVHPTLATLAIVAQVMALLLVPGEMRRNSALMDELAETHRVPRPGTPEMEAYVEREERTALPPLFQLSRVLLLFAFQVLLLWCYLRFGTEGYRGAPFLPFGLAAIVLLTLGQGLNAIHDPDRPTPPVRAWPRALGIGGASLALVLWIATFF